MLGSTGGGTSALAQPQQLPAAGCAQPASASPGTPPAALQPAQVLLGADLQRRHPRACCWKCTGPTAAAATPSGSKHTACGQGRYWPQLILAQLHLLQWQLHLTHRLLLPCMVRSYERTMIHCAQSCLEHQRLPGSLCRCDGVPPSYGIETHVWWLPPCT